MFNCSFPNCDYKTDKKSLIDFHHIVPKEVNPRKTNKVTVSLCKNHHAKIFHPDSKQGQHSRLHDDSIHIINLLESTNGKVLHYLDYKDNEEKYHFLRD